jgi:hypothetical protein
VGVVDSQHWSFTVIKQIGSFIATDNTGRQQTILKFADVLNIDHFEGNASAVGIQSLRTASGQAVNRITQGEYQIVPSGLILRSNSPDAP